MASLANSGDEDATGNAAATVHIVDDDTDLRMALVRLCRSNGLEAHGHANARQLVSEAYLAGPSCIVLDVRLAGDNGLSVQEALREAGNTVPIIFLTGYGTIPMTVRAMRGGAVEFLTKPVEEQTFLGAVRHALAIDAEAVADRCRREDLTERLATLTERELEAMTLAIGGLMNKQIAAEMKVTEITAKVHKGRMMEKMGARSLADLVRIAERLEIAAARSR